MHTGLGHSINTPSVKEQSKVAMKLAKQRSSSAAMQEADYHKQQLLLNPPPIPFRKVKDRGEGKSPEKDKDLTFKKLMVKMNPEEEDSDSIANYSWLK